MDLKPVSSSRISKVGWKDNTLYVQFKNGVIYAYFNVSESEYADFMNSSSLGSSLSILDKIHPYKRL